MAVPLPLAADPLPDHAVPVADYEIRVRLDPDAKRLSGEQRVVWRNPSEERVGEVWFHLYLNAFRNSRSTFLRERSEWPSWARKGGDGWGGIDVTSLRLADGTDLAGRISFEHPDDDNGDDRTVFRLDLPDPVAPGGTIALDMDFEARLPGALVRTGWEGDYFLVGQWFPKLAVYEPAGTRGRKTGGWNAHQFHARSEFYADFGSYRVEITLPGRFVVGATGRRVERREGEGGTTHVFEQADVHDFAWGASPDFLEVRDVFRAAEEVTAEEYQETAQLLGRSVVEVRLRDVEILVLLQPAHAPQAHRLVAAAKASLKWYGLWFGRYPYDTLTIVDPPPGGAGSAGMEYPTFFTSGTVFLFNRWPLDRVLMPEEVILHETAHQFWQGLVATNEFEEPWLDEGFATWSTAKGTVAAYGPIVARVFGLELGRYEGLRLAHGADRDFAPIRGPAWNGSRDHNFNIYARTALTLWTLERLLGERTMARVMRTYHERWRYRHPSSDDFYAVASEVSGRDLSEFFRQTVERPGHLDFAVTFVGSTRLPGPAGLLDDGAEATRFFAAEEEEEGNAATEGAVPWRSTVHVRRIGETVLPVEVELRFEGGRTERRSWDGRTRWVGYTVEGPERLLSAVVDPDDRLVLDVNRFNNARRVDEDPRVADQWGARLLFWLQGLLVLVGL